jgi:hypothetical protein
MDTYKRTDLIHAAVTAVARSLSSARDAYAAEIVTIDAELAALNAKTDRLLTAIENGLDQTDAVDRLAGNRARVKQLRERRSDLIDLTGHAPTDPTDDQLAAIRDSIDTAVTQAEPHAIKRLFESLVHEVRVNGRNSIKPHFRLPADTPPPSGDGKVRALSGTVPPAGEALQGKGLVTRENAPPW